MKKECIAMLLAGGQGSRLRVLTSRVAKPAVPFGGKYRIIDFPLSNCVNSGITTVGVLTQYQPLELNSYIGSGQAWDLDRADGGVHILPPYMTSGGGGWYKGTANAIYQNLDFIRLYDPDYVLILSGDHIYKMDYSKMILEHRWSGAACTIAAMEVPLREASRFGVINADEDGNIYEFEEKPEHPKSGLVSMGIYVFSREALFHYLELDEQDPDSENDFGKNVLPHMLQSGEKLRVYKFSGYWKDVGTLESLWDANMDMLSAQKLDLFDQRWPIYFKSPAQPPHYTGPRASISHSIVTEGCEIMGSVENSVLFNSVVVEEGADIRYSILMPGVHVEKGAKVYYAIVAENTYVGENAVIGAEPSACETEEWGLATCAANIQIGAGAVIKPKAIVARSVGEGAQIC